MTSITTQELILLVIGFGYPLATCTSHLPPKANLAQGGCILSKFKPLQVTSQFSFFSFQTTWLFTQNSALIFSSQLLRNPTLVLDRQGHLGQYIQDQLDLVVYISVRINMRLSISSGSATLGVSASA